MKIDTDYKFIKASSGLNSLWDFLLNDLIAEELTKKDKNKQYARLPVLQD
jgi:hypothetical protein